MYQDIQDNILYRLKTYDRKIRDLLSHFLILYDDLQ